VRDTGTADTGSEHAVARDAVVDQLSPYDGPAYVFDGGVSEAAPPPWWDASTRDAGEAPVDAGDASHATDATAADAGDGSTRSDAGEYDGDNRD